MTNRPMGWHVFAGVALLATACRTAAGPTGAEVPTLTGTQYGYDIAAHKGRTVRVCGRLAQRESRWAVEYVPREGDFFFHGYPAVLIAGCAEARPRLDRNGCLVGRVAALDGSMTPPPRTVHDDRPIDRDWFLHPRCPAHRR